MELASSIPISIHTQMTEHEKIKQIEECLSHNEVNLWQLRELCLTRGGLMTTELRKRSWHKLVGVHPINVTNLIHEEEEEEEENVQEKENSGDHIDDKNLKKDERKLQESLSEDQELISRDVGRAVYFRYPITEVMIVEDTPESNGNSIHSSQKMLTKLILSTISIKTNSGKGGGGRLNYYQGFHDVSFMK
jgi:hypothetical protein